MFRRLWSGLPKDPDFPSDLAGLGYFINDEDEIRSIDDPKSYFKFFITKNSRWNDRQRFAMNEAVQKIVHQRLEAEGLAKVILPLGATNPSEPHLPIFVSVNLASKTRVVIIFGESVQDLGIIAHRIIGGRGGVNKGSMVNIVQALKQQESSPTDSTAPGVILANTGQTWWWPEGKRALDSFSRHATPMASAVHWGRKFSWAKNSIPGNSSVEEHIRYLFEEVIPAMVSNTAKLDIVDACDRVEMYLDLAWDKWAGRMNCLAILGGFTNKDDLTSVEFKEFLKDRARVWTQHEEALDYPISGPEGNPKVAGFTNYGCPVFSAGGALVTETILIETKASVLAWIQEVALTPGYRNSYIEVTAADPVVDGLEWETVEDVTKPDIEFDKMLITQDTKEQDIKTTEDALSGETDSINIKVGFIDTTALPTTVAENKPGPPGGIKPKKEVTFVENSQPAPADTKVKQPIIGQLQPVVTKPEPLEPPPPSEQEALELRKLEMKATLKGFSAALDNAPLAMGDSSHEAADQEETSFEHSEAGRLDDDHARAMVLQFLAQSEDTAMRALELGVKDEDG